MSEDAARVATMVRVVATGVIREIVSDQRLETAREQTSVAVTPLHRQPVMAPCVVTLDDHPSPMMRMILRVSLRMMMCLMADLLVVLPASGVTKELELAVAVYEFVLAVCTAVEAESLLAPAASVVPGASLFQVDQ